jgi:hypothetical protein
MNECLGKGAGFGLQGAVETSTEPHSLSAVSFILSTFFK